MNNPFTELNDQIKDLTWKVENLHAILLANKANIKNIYYDTRATCQILKVTKTTLWRKVKKGEINAYKRGNRMYYKRDELERYIENGKIEIPKI